MCGVYNRRPSNSKSRHIGVGRFSVLKAKAKGGFLILNKRHAMRSRIVKSVISID